MKKIDKRVDDDRAVRSETTDDVPRNLKQAQRMELARKIMDEYDGALKELAKK